MLIPPKGTPEWDKAAFELAKQYSYKELIHILDKEEHQNHIDLYLEAIKVRLESERMRNSLGLDSL